MHIINNLAQKSIPCALFLLIPVLILLILYVLQNNNLINLGLYSINTVVATSVVIFNVLGLLCLYKICSPLNKYRTIVLIAACGAVLLMIAASLIVTIVTKQTEPVLLIPYLDFNGPAIMCTAIIIAICFMIYMFVNRIADIKKGDNLENEN